MNNIIKILSQKEAQKIAAGEVVERPSNIVKEIIENSIDAQSSKISLYIEEAGKKLIRIVDNGLGMSKQDAKLCFEPHATSKITSINDLSKINSFGFRGEALASISSVSKIILITKNSNNNLGIKLGYQDGKFLNEEEIAANSGTDLSIQDLFYNIPVRKKFLKQDETEWNQILNIFQAFCLSNLKIHFKLFKDNKLILNAPPIENVKDRTAQLWGHNFSQNLIVLNKIENTIKQKSNNLLIDGYISNYNFWQYGRHKIFFFVNNRFIKNTELSKSLMKGYLNVLPPGRFPAAFVFININNEEIDINVHPKKEEIRFIKPKTIENYLQRIIKETLENNFNKQFQKPIEQKKHYSNFETFENNSNKIYENFDQPILQKKIAVNNFSQTLTTQDLNIKKQIDNIELPSHSTKQDIVSTQKILNNGCTCSSNLQSESKLNEEINLKLNNTPYYKIIGQLLNTYIIIENQEGLVLIDQHAAHERILYEKFLKNFEKKDGTKLMFPLIIDLSETQLNIILNEKEFFNNQGIEIERFGENQIAIKSSPPKIQNQSLKELIFEIIEFIQENENLDTQIFRKKLNEHMHSQMACKAAIKAGDELSFNLMKQIIDDLQKTDNRFICAHGRPTTWSLSKYQIEKNFKRK